MDKYAVCLKKRVISHCTFAPWESWRLYKKLLIFQAGEYGHCKVVVKGIAINMGNCKDMHN